MEKDYEFIGGPKCGDYITLPKPIPYIQLPIKVDISFDTIPTFKTATYHYKEGKYIYVGE